MHKKQKESGIGWVQRGHLSQESANDMKTKDGCNESQRQD